MGAALQASLRVERSTFFGIDRLDVSQSGGLSGLARVVLQHKRAEKDFFQIQPRHHSAMAAHENRPLVADRFRQLPALLRRFDKISLAIKWNAFGEQCSLQRDWAERPIQSR
jgi:hypothetical protein